MKKRYKLKKSAKDIILSVALFYALIIIGVIMIDFRLGQINDQQKSADVSEVQTAQIHSVN
ncbi:MAG TPA: hypothetical protein DCE23_04265 [Firmicutes bacterium]|nr:hypothetical protein [Bacillota bacterium]